MLGPGGRNDMDVRKIMNHHKGSRAREVMRLPRVACLCSLAGFLGTQRSVATVRLEPRRLARHLLALWLRVLTRACAQEKDRLIAQLDQVSAPRPPRCAAGSWPAVCGQRQASLHALHPRPTGP